MAILSHVLLEAALPSVQQSGAKVPFCSESFPWFMQVCMDTIVGNDMIRGISGGQKKRVTTGEMIVGPCKTLFLDEVRLTSLPAAQAACCCATFCGFAATACWFGVLRTWHLHRQVKPDCMTDPI